MRHDPVEQVFEHLADGRLGEALEELDRLLREEPYHGPLFALRALILADLDRLDPAAEDSARARDMAPEHPFVHFAAGTVALRQGAVLDAIRHAKAAQEVAPGYPEAMLLEARARAVSGQWARAAALADAVLELEPGNEEAAVLGTVARAAEQEGTLDRSAWASLADRFPLSPVARAGTGWTRLTAGEAAAARGEFEQALALDPGLAWAKEGLALSLKARNPVYALLLRFFLWFGRLPGGTRMTVLLGGVIGYNLLRRAAEADPGLRPVLVPLLVGYVAFVVLSWLADPLLDLVLMARPEGRRLLRPEERRAAIRVGACLTLAVALGAISQTTSWERAGLGAIGLAFTSLALSAAARRDGRRGTQLQLLAALAFLLSLAAGVAPAEAAGLCLLGAVLCSAASTWLSHLGAER